MSEEKINSLIISLFKCGALKFGEFTVKSGILSPVNFDLRVIISHPDLMILVSELVWDAKERNSLEMDVICVTPYTTLPVATLVSAHHNVPMLLKRQEQNKYGTGKLIEGEYKNNSRCLIVEDVITTGSSIVETVKILRQHGLVVEDAIVILDRDQGAVTNLSRNGIIRVHSLISMGTMLRVLAEARLISDEIKSQVENFISSNKLFDTKIEKAFSGRISALKNQKAKDLLKICYKKSTNLCLSADLEKRTDVIEIVKQLGPKICLLKTHIDTLNFENYSEVLEFRDKLKNLSEEFDFLIMEDMKLADIGNTVTKQLTAKPFQIDKWAHFVTVRGSSGPSIFQSIADCNLSAVAIVELSCEGNLMTKLPEYKNLVGEISQDVDCVAGFVSQSSVGAQNNQKYLQFTAGVSLDCGGDGKGQQYCIIEEAILERNADIIIVGPAIFKGRGNWVQNADVFQTRGWKALSQKYKCITGSCASCASTLSTLAQLNARLESYIEREKELRASELASYIEKENECKALAERLEALEQKNKV